MRPIATFATSFLVISGSPLLAQQAAGTTSAAPRVPDNPEAVYQEYCAGCHGTTNRLGNTGSLFDEEWKYGGSDEAVFRSIKVGIPQNGMPGYAETFTDEQIRELMAYMDEQREKGVELEPAPAREIETRDYVMEGTVLSEELTRPWGLTFWDEDRALITERPGTVRWMIKDFVQPEPVRNTPAVFEHGQGGLMDVAFDPDYEENGWIYLVYTHKLDGEPEDSNLCQTRVARGKINDANEWVEQQVVWEARPEDYRGAGRHFGSRIAFDEAGRLYFSIGDRGAKNQAQELGSPNGKIYRVNRDGSIPEDNPFVDQEGAYAGIYAYGSRNAQGLAFHPETGQLWEVEHGPKGGDELNVIKKGVNYGWPVITYGVNYNGTPITEITRKEGMAQPIIHWTPSIAVCALEFYTGEMFPKWQNNALATALKFQELRRITIDGEDVKDQEVLVKDAGRVRDVAVSPSGAIYLVLNGPDQILKLTPKQ
jgi:glucose/arabinose dehydrogenase